MSEEKTLTELAQDYPELVKWYHENKESFCHAIGVWGPDDMMVLALWSLRRYIDGDFPMIKDDIERARCDLLSDFVEGKAVEEKDLRIAVALLMESYGGACDAIWSLRKRLMEQQRPRPQLPPRKPPPRHVPRPRRPGPVR